MFMLQMKILRLESVFQEVELGCGEDFQSNCGYFGRFQYRELGFSQVLVFSYYGGNSIAFIVQFYKIFFVVQCGIFGLFREG